MWAAGAKEAVEEALCLSASARLELILFALIICLVFPYFLQSGFLSPPCFSKLSIECPSYNIRASSVGLRELISDGWAGWKRASSSGSAGPFLLLGGQMLGKLCRDISSEWLAWQRGKRCVCITQKSVLTKTGFDELTELPGIVEPVGLG